MDLIVDASLDEINRDLKAIHDEFSNAGKSADQNAGIWGQADVAKAMDAFADNWYVHREAINDRLGKLSDRVNAACETWIDAEKQLAASLETAEGDSNA